MLDDPVIKDSAEFQDRVIWNALQLFWGSRRKKEGVRHLPFKSLTHRCKSYDGFIRVYNSMVLLTTTSY